MASPALFGPDNLSTLLQNGLVLNGGQRIRNDGRKNYVSYSTFARNLTTGWSLGTATLTSAFPSGAPTFGSGASGNLSISTSSSSPLDIQDLYSLLYVSSAATTAGNFLASDALPLDSEAQGNVLGFRFAYNASVNPTNMNLSGTSSNSYGVAFYDVTNSAWIQPAGVYNLVQSSGTGFCSGTIQIPITCASIRMVVFNANATAGAATLKMDDFYLGPQVIVAGAAITDPVAYTPTFTGFGTAASVNFVSWREGAYLCVEGKFTTGTCTATEARISLGFGGGNSNVTSLSTLASPQLCGYQAGPASGTSVAGTVLIEPSVSYLTLGFTSVSSTGLTKLNGNSFTNASAMSLFARVPIAGWSSNTVMSNDTDTRSVVAIITGDPASATSGNPIIVPTVSYDSHGAYSASTGRYTVPVTGQYKLYGALQSASSATTLTIYKNAVSTSLAGNLDSNGEATYCSSVNCIAGDIIDIRPGGTVDATNMTLNIERLSGPATVAASESINARYYASATAITGSLATIVWTTKDFDSHNAMSSSGYTCPVSGKYQVDAALALAGTFTLNNTTVIEIQKNGTAVSNLTRYLAAAVTQDGIDIEDQVSCLAGDVLRIQVSSSATLPSIVSSNTRNYISIFRTGN